MDDFDKGQQVDAFNGMANKDETVREMADRLGHVKIVEYLEAHGADINISKEKKSAVKSKPKSTF